MKEKFLTCLFVGIVKKMKIKLELYLKIFILFPSIETDNQSFIDF